MSLEIDTGFLAHRASCNREGAAWLRKEVATVNQILRSNKLPTFTEPETLPPREARVHQIGYSAGDLHLLRRAWLLTKEREQVTPLDDPMAAVEVELDLASVYPESHLVCHSDRDGYYAPIDFPEVLFNRSIPGDFLGSSQGLLRELLEVAPALGIDPRTFAVPGDEPFARERTIWFGLHEAARLSIAHGSMIVFH